MSNNKMTSPCMILGFDMGIRNLAYCLMEHPANNGPWRIVAWDNVDLLSGGESTETARRCVGCGGPAAFEGLCEGTAERWCKPCATGVRRKKSATRIPTKPVLPCSTKVVDLRRIGVEAGWATKTTKKDELLQSAAQRYLMPWKAPKAVQPSLANIRKQMDSWLDRLLPTFAAAHLIRLENQPVMKGPTMKSIQIMLFSLLGHRLEREFGWKGEIVFVHAGVKSRSVAASAALDAVAAVATVAEDAVATDAVDTDSAAYRLRKKTAEQDTLTALNGRPDMASWATMFQSRSKKNDLADAFLMALRPREKN